MPNDFFERLSDKKKMCSPFFEVSLQNLNIWFRTSKLHLLEKPIFIILCKFRKRLLYGHHLHFPLISMVYNIFRSNLYDIPMLQMNCLQSYRIFLNWLQLHFPVLNDLKKKYHTEGKRQCPRWYQCWNSFRCWQNVTLN